MPSGGGGQGLCRRACLSGDLSSRDEVVAVEEFDVEDVTKDGVEEELVVEEAVDGEFVDDQVYRRGRGLTRRRQRVRDRGRRPLREKNQG